MNVALAGGLATSGGGGRDPPAAIARAPPVTAPAEAMPISSVRRTTNREAAPLAVRSWQVAWCRAGEASTRPWAASRPRALRSAARAGAPRVADIWAACSIVTGDGRGAGVDESAQVGTANVDSTSPPPEFSIYSGRCLYTRVEHWSYHIVTSHICASCGTIYKVIENTTRCAPHRWNYPLIPSGGLGGCGGLGGSGGSSGAVKLEHWKYPGGAVGGSVPPELPELPPTRPGMYGITATRT